MYLYEMIGEGYSYPQLTYSHPLGRFGIDSSTTTNFRTPIWSKYSSKEPPLDRIKSTAISAILVGKGTLDIRYFYAGDQFSSAIQYANSWQETSRSWFRRNTYIAAGRHAT